MSQVGLFTSELVLWNAPSAGRRVRRSPGRWSTPGSRALGGRHHELRQVLGTGNVVARKAGGLDEVRAGHAELVRLRVHRRHEGRDATRIVTRQGMRGAVFRGHEGQVEQVAAGESRTGCQARERALADRAVLVGDLDHFVQRLLRIHDHQRRHELRDGCDRHRHVGVPRIQDGRMRFVEDESRAGSQRGLVKGTVARVIQACRHGGGGRRGGETERRRTGVPVPSFLASVPDSSTPVPRHVSFRIESIRAALCQSYVTYF